MKSSLISIGIDIGGTKIFAAALQDSKIIGETLSYKTPSTSEEILNTILRAIEILQEKHNPVFVGIATAGAVNIDNTRVTGSTGNLPSGYSDIEFEKIISEKFKMKTFVENDANAAAYAEYKVGASKGHKNTIVITLGTGIGGGIIVENKLLRGKSGAAGEVGHIKLSWEKKRKCTCGSWDCWEAYASGTGFAKNAQEMAKELPKFKDSILKDKKADSLTTHHIIEAMSKGDLFSQKVFERWEDYVLTGLIGLVNIFDPESIVLSGGMAKFIDFEKLQNQINAETVTSEIKLVHAESGNFAGLIGAAIMAEEKFSNLS